jgi:uncharacterized membrane protein YdcZ (DUF606 family)
MKWLGYVIAIIGAIGVLLKTEMVKKLLVKVPLPVFTQTTTFMIGSIVVVVIGLVLIFMGGKSNSFSKGKGEVPIYHGNQIIGYRRV